MTINTDRPRAENDTCGPDCTCAKTFAEEAAELDLETSINNYALALSSEAYKDGWLDGHAQAGYELELEVTRILDTVSNPPKFELGSLDWSESSGTADEDLVVLARMVDDTLGWCQELCRTLYHELGSIRDIVEANEVYTESIQDRVANLEEIMTLVRLHLGI